MRTRCYCIFCPNHPLYKIRHLFKDWVVGYTGGGIWQHKYGEQGILVDCLEPDSAFFDDFDIDPEELDFLITAYGDGCSITTSENLGYTVYATCKNERYEEE